MSVKDMTIQQVAHWRTQDSQGIVMPWYTRPCLEWLNTLPLDGKRIFEYGCGESSLWYHSKGAIISGVDSKNEWINFPFNQVLTTDPGRYCATAARSGEFDIIIIDGDFRDDCTEYALHALKKGGYLIIDNYEQASADLPDWPKTKELTKDLPVTLYKEPNHPDWVTAVWQKNY